MCILVVVVAVVFCLRCENFEVRTQMEPVSCKCFVSDLPYRSYRSSQLSGALELFFPTLEVSPSSVFVDRCDWLYVMTCCDRHVNCNVDWLKTPQSRTRLFPGRGQVEDGAVPEVLPPPRKGTRSFKNDTFVWLFRFVADQCHWRCLSVFVQNAVSAVRQRGFHRSAPAAVQVSVSS